MRFFSVVSTLLMGMTFLTATARADVRFFSGDLEVITASGKACAGRTGIHPVSLVIGSEDGTTSLFGYVGGDTVTVGQLHGPSLDALTVHYPFPGAEADEGHRMNITINGSTLTGELRDKHLEVSADDCNFDLARFRLLQVAGDEAAQAAYQRLSLQFEAQLARSTALALARKGSHAEASQAFEKALALADKLYPTDSKRLLPYLTGLANSYMRSGQFQNFSSLYNSRIGTLQNDAALLIFNHHQIRSLLNSGRAALGRDEYQTALKYFRQVLQIDYKNKDAISAIMSALVRSGRHDEAIAFLEETEEKLDNSSPDRNDVREAIALIKYQKAKKEQSAGRTSEAERLLRTAIRLDPGTTHYLVVLARWVHKAGKYSEADAILKRAIDSFTDEARRQELMEAREKLQQTELILARIRKAGY